MMLFHCGTFGQHRIGVRDCYLVFKTEDARDDAQTRTAFCNTCESSVDHAAFNGQRTSAGIYSARRSFSLTTCAPAATVQRLPIANTSALSHCPLLHPAGYASSSITCSSLEAAASFVQKNARAQADNLRSTQSLR